MSNLTEPVASRELIPDSFKMEELRAILENALRAPSGDNCQPWSFEWDGKTLTILHDPERSRHSLDCGQSATFLALGCLLESLAIASSAFQLGIEPEVLGLDEEKKGPCARVRFSAAPVKPDPLVEVLSRRTTDRRLYRGGPLPLTRLQEESSQFHSDPTVGIFGTEEISGELKTFILETESLVALHPHFLKDTLRWVRFGRSNSNRDGMPWQSLGVGFMDGFALWNVRTFPWILRLMRGYARYNHCRTVERRLRSSAGVICFAVSSLEPAAVLQAGRVAMRTWLQLSGMHYGVHPLTLSSLTIYGAKTGRLDPSSEIRFKELFLSGERILREHLGIPETHTPVWMFRTGRSSEIPETWRTRRREISQTLRTI